jgi:serine protease Do
MASAKILTSNMASNNPVVDVVKATRAGIVQIRVEATVNVSNNNPFMDDDFFRYFFQQPQQRQRPVTSMGSGFIYEYNTSTREAFIMTNNHVVEKGKDGKITVTLADKVTYEGTVVGLDPNTDVAVIKITVKDGEKVTVVPLGDSSKLEIGEWAIAIGNPFGDAGLDRTVTLGVISALGRANLKFGDSSPAYQDYIQTDAAINPGNSGGPLLNINGEVIGVNAAITSTSGGNIGIGFAIPINLAKKVVDDLVATGKVARGFIGILPQEISQDIMESFNLKEVAGVLVANVEKDSPAEKAGLKAGDVILEFNNERVPNVPKFRIAVATSAIGKALPVKIVRDNKEEVIKITLDAFPDDGTVATLDKGGKAPVGSGISVEALDSQIAKRLGVTADKGVVVTAVSANSPAAKAGIEVGAVIASVEGIEVNSPADFNKVMTDVQSKMEKAKRKIIRLYVIDKNKTPQFVVLRFE